MAQALADQYGGYREKCERVASVGFAEGAEGNVATAFAGDGSALFDFAWRPHKPSPESNQYTEEGLFFC
jgi:hypothetical protein